LPSIAQALLQVNHVPGIWVSITAPLALTHYLGMSESFK